ncbi:MAG: Glutamyl-tRNA(Gln) amidotransferase subunit A [Alphaproteobacteria bacterium MarineAlpha11_Bin1]|mgnify:CR=1 FL=1|nr:MAG: Glutamyl-tRNA(Gln) amidotransferase subunit A [Alphaproteobacteria bacterium MarineAlpha11_Bin1]
MGPQIPKLRSYFAATGGFADGSDSPSAFLERCIAEMEAREDDVKAFVCRNLNAARAVAEASTKRWQTGKQFSLIDGMPVGVKDVMETADMPTSQGSPLFVGMETGRDCAAVVALREAGAIMVGKTVTTEFAATHPGVTRNPWDLERTPGGSSSGSAAAVGSGMLSGGTGSQVIGSIIRPSGYCGAFGYKPSVGGINRGGSFDGFSQSCTGMIAASLAECWLMTREITSRTGGDAGYTGVIGPMELPAAKKPKKIAMLYTAGWGNATDCAKAEWQRARDTFEASGIAVQDRSNNAEVEAVEQAIFNAMELSMNINAWEGRFPLDTYERDMDSSKLSESAHNRLKQALSMTQDQFSELLVERDRVRNVYAALNGQFDVCVTLSAPGAAPRGLEWTGDPLFTVPTSLVGMPTVTLPLLQDEGLPLGLQIIGHTNADADLFAHAGGILNLF